tara:strand:+ start:1150 stop:1416 length:267 start_codon:yes stop_codon:yes gene_type:complete
MLYTQGSVSGAGFLTHTDRANGVELQLWGNVIVVPDGCEAWLIRNSLTAISKAAAQALYDTHTDAAIAAFDPDDNSEGRAQPARGTLP